MKLLAHRGVWREPKEKNTLEAIKEAIQNGYGFESDVRDFEGQLVISHDPAGKDSLKLEAVLKELCHDKRSCFAVNIKADGLKESLSTMFTQYGIENYFTFDMSVPQMFEYLEKGIRVFTRQSEFETTPVFYEQAAGIWIDSFQDPIWITRQLLEEHIKKGKEICLVSPELHGAKPYHFWERLREYPLDFSKLMLCTDRIKEAAEIFRDKLEV